MPNVPYAPVTDVSPSTAQPSDYITTQASPNDFGAQIGQAAQGLGQTVEKAGSALNDVAVQQQTRVNSIANDDAYNQILDISNKKIAGDPNNPADRGYFGLRGQDAVNGHADAINSLMAAQASISAGLSNDAQRIKFNADSRRLLAYQTGRINDHYEQQFTQSAAATLDATQSNINRSIAIDYNNDDHFQHSLADKLATADKQSALVGASDEVFAANRAKASQEAYTTRAVEMGNANPAAGLAYVQSHADQFDAISLHRLTDEFKTGADKQSVAAGVQDIIGGGPGTSGVSIPQTGGPTLSSIHPDLTSVAAPNGGAKFTVAKSAAPAFQGLVNDLTAAGYNIDPATSGGYNPRNIAGTNTPSMHAYGLAVDVNWAKNPQGANTASDIPPDLAHSLAAKWGLKWGGDFSGKDRDPMHFEVAGGPPDSQPVTAPTAGPTGFAGQMAAALHPQEGPGTSVQGAVQGLMPATFTQYAKPGESFTNPTDRATVNNRVISDLAARYPNDPARVAVGYFSGPGNVSAPGSATPYIADKTDGNGKSTSSYVSDISARMQGQTPGAVPAAHDPQAYGVEQQMVQQAQQHAQALFPNRPDLQKEMVQGVYQHIAETNVLQAKYEAEQAKATRDNQETAGQTILKQLMTDPSKFDPAIIRDNPSLTYEQKEQFWRLAQSHMAAGVDDKDIKTYGSGFYQAFQNVHAAANDPNRITDPSQLYSHVGPNGDLTVAGVDKLTQMIQNKRTPEGEADATLQKQFFAVAHNEIAGRSDLMHMRDPKGDELYLKFMAKALPALEAARTGGAAMSDLVNPDGKGSLYPLIAQYARQPGVWMQDMHEANEMPGATDTTQAGKPAAAAPTLDLNSSDGILAAVRDGKLDGPTAQQMLVSKGFARARPVAPAPAATVPTPSAPH